MSPRARQRKSAADACFRVLVIDDEQDMLTNLRRILGRAGHDCHTLDDPAGLEAALEDYQPHLVLTDLVMPQGSGMDVLERAQRFDPELPVIILTAHGSIEGAVEALHKHAADYLTKPFSADDVLRKIQRLLSNRLVGDNAPAPRSARGDNRRWRKEIIGVSPVMERLLELTQRVARTDVNVLVAGASGTGKEVIARAIHRLSGRAREIFVPVDCASLPENLLESELFGYRRGAFTGATSDKMGLIEFAHKGTLFLDEIGEMPLALQAKLLRVLQERQFRPIGGRELINVDVRVVAATNVDLEKAVEERTFRRDLYYRLNVVTLTVPPLSEHPDDIPLLAEHYLRRFARDNHLTLHRISPEAMHCLRAHEWSGNVRELINVVEYAATMAVGDRIEPQDLPEAVRAAGKLEGKEVEPPRLFESKDHLVRGFERDYLVSLLVEHRFNVSEAARAAGCHRRTLYRMIHRHGLDIEALRRDHSGHDAARSGGTDDSAPPAGADRCAVSATRH